MAIPTARVAAILFLCALGALAQEPLNLEALTHRGADLDAIVADLATKAQAELTKPDAKSLIVWLVDDTPEMARTGQYQRLATAIKKHFAAAGRVQHTVVLIDRQLRQLQKPTADVAEVERAVLGVAKQPAGAVRDTMAAIRVCAEAFRRTGDVRAIVLFTIENGDTESELEATARLLAQTKTRLYAISREGVIADPYWERRPTEAKVHRLDLAGRDAPFMEFPWGFLFMLRDPHESVPAGYGIYGPNRLAAASGGACYLYDPPAEPARCYCSWATCQVCDGVHSRCGAHYEAALLETHAPGCASRTHEAALIEKSPTWRVIHDAWAASYRMGIVRSLPPELPGSRSTARSRGTKGYYAWNLTQLDHAKAKAAQDRVELAGWIAQLDALPRPKTQDVNARRALATADALVAQLIVTRFNLLQLIALADHAKEVESGQPLTPLEKPLVVRRSSGPLSVTYYSQPFCHGTRAIREMMWLGGAEADREIGEVADRLDGLILAHLGTPWELVIRRASVVRFRLYEPVKGTEIAQHRRETSDTDPPETSESDRPARERGAAGGAAKPGGTVTGK